MGTAESRPRLTVDAFLVGTMASRCCAPASVERPVCVCVCVCARACSYGHDFTLRAGVRAGVDVRAGVQANRIRVYRVSVVVLMHVCMNMHRHNLKHAQTYDITAKTGV